MTLTSASVHYNHQSVNKPARYTNQVRFVRKCCLRIHHEFHAFGLFPDVPKLQHYWYSLSTSSLFLTIINQIYSKIEYILHEKYNICFTIWSVNNFLLQKNISRRQISDCDMEPDKGSLCHSHNLNNSIYFTYNNTFRVNSLVCRILIQFSSFL